MIVMFRTDMCEEGGGGQRWPFSCTLLICRHGPTSRWQPPSGRAFFTSTSTTAQSQQQQNPLRPQLPPSISYPGSLLPFEPPVVRNKLQYLSTNPIIFLPHRSRKRTTTMSRWRKMTQSHHLLYTCAERALGSLRNRPCKVIRLIL